VPLKIKGAGKAGCPMHPQPPVGIKKPHEHSHHRFAEAVRPSLRNGFNGLFSCSPRRPGSFATVIGGSASANLTPASGCQDRTTSPSAIPVFAKRLRQAWSLPKLQRRRLKLRPSCAAIASTASRLTSVTFAKRPSIGTGRGECSH
jgi:hypothetical protein